MIDDYITLKLPKDFKGLFTSDKKGKPLLIDKNGNISFLKKYKGYKVMIIVATR